MVEDTSYMFVTGKTQRSKKPSGTHS
jgi:hypothetical protein